MEQECGGGGSDFPPPGQVCPQLSTCYQSDRLHKREEPGGHAGRGCHEFRQSLGKNPLGTGGGATDEFAHGEQKENIPTSTGQVGDCSLVGSMDASGGLLARRASHACG